MVRLDSRPVTRAGAVALSLAALALAAAGLVLLAREGPVTTRAVHADGVPLLVFTGAQPSDAGVVVAHGFAGSARLMRGFAETLARRGYAVAIPDLAGHGANPRPLSLDDDATLAGDIDAAVRYLRTAFALPEDRIALVGHSMGAGAVTRYSVEHPRVPATVAISLGSADDLPADPARPRNLLLVVGGLEFASFRTATVEAQRRADPGAQLGVTIVGAGTARRATVVPGREHISVLFADQTHRETAEWLDRSLGRPSTSVDPQGRDRLLPAGLLLLGFLIGFVPLAALLLRPVALPTTSPTEPPTEPPAEAPAEPSAEQPAAPPVAARPAGVRVAVGAAIGLTAAVLGAQFLPTVALPLAVGGYTAGFLVVVAAALITLAMTGPTRAPVRGRDARAWVAAPVLAAYAAVAVAVPIHLGFTNAQPVGARWWLMVVVASAAFALLLGVELAAAGRWVVRVLLLLATASALGAAAMLGTGPRFVLVVLPLLVLLLAWYAAWSAVAARRGSPPWLPAVFGAVLVAWPVATTLPIMA